MIGGLKSYLPRLAAIVGTSTPAALYERQRALTRLGLLIAQEGRGPGSGIKLSADSLAVMIISLLMTENLSDIDKRVVRLCNCRPADGGACHVTGAKNFRQAVAVLFTDASFSRQGKRLISFGVEQNRGARIDYNEAGKGWRHTRFEPGAERSAPVPLITRKADASPELIRLIADDLAALLPVSGAEVRPTREAS